MAYATQTQHTASNGFVARLNDIVISLKARRARRRVFTQTFRELSALTDRELTDMGLRRGQLRNIAYQAAYEV